MAVRQVILTALKRAGTRASHAAIISDTGGDAARSAQAAVRTGSGGDSGGRKGWLWNAVGFALIGATGAATYAALDEYVLFQTCRGRAMAVALAHPALQDALGGPLVEGSWYNASIKPSADGQLVSCSIPVTGARAGSEITLRALRSEGGLPRLLYNTIGSAKWEVLMLDAMLPARGGLPAVRRSVLCRFIS